MITAETVGNWLISTPAGVLLLSAAGSLLGLGVLRLSNYAFIFLRRGFGCDHKLPGLLVKAR